MLAPDLRSLLTSALQPPAGMRLEHAVATTFTLDLEALLLVPLAFAGFGIDESADPIEILESLRSLGDRLDVFCQAGMISADRELTDLVALLEKSVHEVHRPAADRIFHPKVWALHYTDETEDAYRLLVLTRNLTHDSSWDLMVRLDGTPSRAIQQPNEEIAKFLRALEGFCREPLSEDRVRRVDSLAEQLRRVDWDVPEPANSVQFYALGLDRRPKFDLSELFKGSRQLIISPFVTDEGVNQITRHCETNDVTIVSRHEDLSRLKPETTEGFDLFVLDPAAQLDLPPAGDAEPADDATPAQESGFLGALHAKCYLTEFGKQAWMVVGSANATRSAFGGNVEFLVALIGGRSKMGIDTFLDEDPGETNLYTLLERFGPTDADTDDDDDDTNRRLDEALMDIAEISMTTTVMLADEGWRPTVTSARPVPNAHGFELTVSLANRPTEARALAADTALDECFAVRPLVEITPLLRFTARSGDAARSALVLSVLDGAPDDRLDQILAAQLDTPEKFMKFLLLLLGLAHEGHALRELGADPTDATWTHTAFRPAGLLELLLTALATRPEAIDRLTEVVERLQNSEPTSGVFPDDWEKVWPVVLEARRTMGVRIDND